MGCRGGFSRKMQKTGGGGAKIAPPNETRVNMRYRKVLDEYRYDMLHLNRLFKLGPTLGIPKRIFEDDIVQLGIP